MGPAFCGSGILTGVRNQFSFAHVAVLLTLGWAVQSPALSATPIGNPSIGNASIGNPSIGNLQISEVWSRPTPPASSVGALYFRIKNLGAKADLLVGVSSPAAAKMEIHESRSVQGVMQMREVESLPCPAGATVKVEPGGLHVMLVGLVQPLRAGSMFDVTLRFRDAGTLTLRVPVEARE
jgi:copper(I)-binding protein